MEAVATLRDADIFETPIAEPKEYIIRPTSKGIVIDSDGKIALLSTRGHGLFPGGGIEEGETPEVAFVRECKEEIGCDIEILKYLGQFDQFRARDRKKYEVYFYVAKVMGDKGAPTTTSPGELKCILTWEIEANLLSILESQISHIPLDEYLSQFNCRTHLLAFKKFLKINKE